MTYHYKYEYITSCTSAKNRRHEGVSLQAVDKFLQAKGKLDGNGTPPLNDIMDTLHSLTTVRANLAAGLSSGE